MQCRNVLTILGEGRQDATHDSNTSDLMQDLIRVSKRDVTTMKALRPTALAMGLEGREICVYSCTVDHARVRHHQYTRRIRSYASKEIQGL